MCDLPSATSWDLFILGVTDNFTFCFVQHHSKYIQIGT